MFDSLSTRLNGVFETLTRRGALSEADVNAALRDVRIALLEADVALPVVKDFVAGVSAKAVGADVLKSVAPGQQVIKIVNDHLIEMLGGETAEISIAAANPPAAVLMVGLQGSGKDHDHREARPLPAREPQEARADGLARYQPACGHGAAGDSRCAG